MARDTITISITVKSTNTNAVHWNGGCKNAWHHVDIVPK